jgi:hypothetical protein
MRRGVRMVAMALTLAGAAACRDCSCQKTEDCKECVARCVASQGVSEEICQTTACASVCQERNK